MIQRQSRVAHAARPKQAGGKDGRRKKEDEHEDEASDDGSTRQCRWQEVFISLEIGPCG